jgi:hypothetical protein
MCVQRQGRRRPPFHPAAAEAGGSGLAALCRLHSARPSAPSCHPVTPAPASHLDCHRAAAEVGSHDLIASLPQAPEALLCVVPNLRPGAARSGERARRGAQPPASRAIGEQDRPCTRSLRLRVCTPHCLMPVPAAPGPFRALAPSPAFGARQSARGLLHRPPARCRPPAARRAAPRPAPPSRRATSLRPPWCAPTACTWSRSRHSAQRRGPLLRTRFGEGSGS